jgi:hypothetical protein
MNMTKLTLIKNEEATATLGEFISSFGTFGVLGILGGILYTLVMSLPLVVLSCLIPGFIPITLLIVPFALPINTACICGLGWVLDYILSLTTAT